MAAVGTVTRADVLGARILIVDDREANVLLLDRILRGAGYTAVTSTSDSAGVGSLHRAQPYDLILLDLEMPGIDGFQVMEELKQVEIDGYLPVLAITAEPRHKLRALEGGAKDFLAKPFERPEVLARVRNLLEVRLLHLATKRLYQDLIAEQKRALTLGALPGTMVGVESGETIETP